MIGTEKQITWAKKIKLTINQKIKDHFEYLKEYDNESINNFDLLNRKQTIELEKIINNMETADRYIYVRNFTLYQIYTHLQDCIAKKISI